MTVLISGSASQVDAKGQKPLIKIVVHHQDSDREEREKEEEKEGMECEFSYTLRPLPCPNARAPDDAVFQRTIELIETSTSKHFQATSSSDAPRARNVIKIVAHRVVHGGAETEPMAIWPGHEQGLEQLDKLSQFAPLHVSLLGTRLNRET